MKKKEREILREAIERLERNPCEWEEAMVRLHALAGLEYRDPRKIKGAPIGLAEIMTGKVPNVEGNGRPNRRRSRLFGRLC